jgi:hypothetical protein
MVFCDLVFADTVYLKNGERIENATITEITPTDIKYKVGGRTVVYTISKNDAIKIAYSDGSEDIFSMEEIKSVEEAVPLEQNANAIAKKDTSYIMLTAGYSGLGLNAFVHLDWINNVEIGNLLNLFIAGFGFGLVEKGAIAASGDIQFGVPLSNQFYMTLGLNPRVSLDEFEFVTYVGFLYKQWLFNLGYSGGSEGGNLSLNAGYIFESIKEEKIITEKKEEKSEKSSTRYFRPGIEINYPVYRSEIEFFDNSFPYLAGGAGLFFRIGPEYFYFTTGAYAKEDVLYKEGIASKDFGILGINLGSVPLLDLEWDRVFVEIPLLFSFGSGQIRFTGGVLLDFYVLSEVNVNVNENIPIVGGQNIISASDAEKIEDRFSEIPEGNLYVVLGLDIDIMRHWGVGVKCLIWGGDRWGDSDMVDIDTNMGIEPSRFQTRVSTYFVF